MNFRRQLILPLSLFLLTSVAHAVQPFMPRYPAISPDGATVVFSFQGDLWSMPASGGQAVRLTAHPAYDAMAVFSPDGSKIAFASDRYGDNDIFVIPAQGGAPERLTYASTLDMPGAFSSDGKTFYFAAPRPFKYPQERQIQSVPVSGGTPNRIADFWGDEVAVSADGNTFIIAYGRVKPGRVHYRGSYQREIYSYTPGQDPIQLTDHEGYDVNPMVAPDGTIYWLTDADESMTQNVWKMDGDGSNKTQVTFFDDHVRAASLSGDGSSMVLEQGTDLFLLSLTDDAEPRKLEIDVAADLIDNPVVIENKTNGAKEISVTSDGEELALIVEGEIVLVNRDLGGRAAVAVPASSREEEITFRPGSGDTLAFVTDRFGDKVLCLLVSDDPTESNLRLAKKHKIIQLTDGSRAASSPVWSPSGDRLAYILGNGDLHVMKADGSGDKVISTGWAAPDVQWSPDGKWFAYTVEDRNFNNDVWIRPSDGSGKPVNVSQHPDNDYNAVWSQDGRMLAWNTNRHGNQADIYMVYLTRADDEMTKEEWTIYEKTRDKKKKSNASDDESKDKKGKKEDAKEDQLTVKIDFEDIHLRSRRMTSLPGGEYMVAIHPMGDKLFFTASISEKRDLYSVNRFGEEMEAVTSGGTSPQAIIFDPENKTFHYLKSGKPNSVGMDGGKSSSTDFSARITIDKPARRLQILDEGWRVLGATFYDPAMHGIDWAAKHAKYYEWAKLAGHERDFEDILNWMIGEVNASHMGYYPERSSDNGPAPDGYLGLEFDAAHTGDGLKVSRVIPRSPADREKSRILPGDILKFVNGRPVSRQQNYYAALEMRSGVPTEVILLRGAKQTVDLEILPVNYSTIRDLLYDEMEQVNRARVEAASSDRVGYLHIRAMGMGEVERFEMNLYAAADDKEALIIDVRNNGGGWTTDYLLTILTQPVHAYTIARDGEVGYPQDRYPLYRWEKPIAVLCNEGSYSNAEIFSHAIQTIGRGPVIGNTTGGNVISTSGWSTLDGGWIRMPMRGWYVWGGDTSVTPERNNLNQEGNGCIPDYLVQKTPADWMNDRDPQIDKAVELMLEAADREATLPKPSPNPESKAIWKK